MKRHLTDIKISILVLVLASLVCVLSLIEPDANKNSESVMSAYEVSSIVPDVFSSGELSEMPRRPASINSEAAKSQIINAAFLCDEKTKNEKVQQKVGKLMMMNFKVCAKNAVSVSLINESNGFKAQVFKIDTENYKTDFIQLSKGSNHLRVQIILKDGQKLEDSLVILTGS